MLKHFLTICPTATYLMKIDDDMFLNTEVVNTIVSDVVGKEQLPLLGKMFDEYRPHRDRESKWYLPYWLYRHPKFPAYLSGTGYLIPGSNFFFVLLIILIMCNNFLGTEVGNILKEASKIPIIPLEDVFYNGLIAGKHLGLKLQHDRRFRDDRPLYKSYHCLYRYLFCIYFTQKCMHACKCVQVYITYFILSEMWRQFIEFRHFCCRNCGMIDCLKTLSVQEFFLL